VFGREGDGGGGRHVGRMKITTSSSRLDARGVVVVVGGMSKWQMDHPWLAFGRKGGGGGGIRVERLKTTTSGSRLDAREVVVVGVTLKCRNQPPPARIWTQGR